MKSQLGVSSLYIEKPFSPALLVEKVRDALTAAAGEPR
jgi:DNA-binding response OmpR family regulator